MTIAEANTPLADGIKGAIERGCISRSALAHKIGLSIQQFSDMLNGRRIIKPREAYAIAEILGVTMDELYGRIN